MKYIKKFNEANSKIDQFYTAYKSFIEQEDEEGNEFTNHERYEEVGQMTNEYGLSKEDVKVVLDTKDCSFDSDRLLQSTYDEWIDDEEDYDGILPIFSNAIQKIIDNNITTIPWEGDEIDKNGIKEDIISWIKDNNYKIVKK